MSILLCFNVILIRKAEIEAKYPGGLAQFRIEFMKGAFHPSCEDDHLVGFSSMARYYDKVVGTVMAHGIEIKETSESFSIDQIKQGVEWLESGLWNSFPICWLKGTQPGDLIKFPWNFEKPKSPAD